MRWLLTPLVWRLRRFLFAFLPLKSNGRRRRKAASLVRSARKPAWVAGRISRLKALMPEAGCRRIADSFNRCHTARTGVSVGKSFVADTLRGQHYAILRDRRHLRRRRAGSGRRNIVWGLDLTGKEDSMRRSSDILGVIDHGTRRLLELTSLAAPSSWTVLGHLCLLIGRFGKPRAVRTGNGAIFTARCFDAFLPAGYSP